MSGRSHRSILWLAVVLVAPTVAVVGTSLGTMQPAGAVVVTPPDLQILVPTSAISIGTNPTTGDRQLQFTHITWDGGTGPFLIQPTYNKTTGMATFTQTIYDSSRPGAWAVDYKVPVVVPGTFDPPSDYRFPLTRFTLNVANPDGTPGAIVAVSPKTDYCITADTYVGGVPNTPSRTTPPQSDCVSPTRALGFSVGWGDEYDQTDNGQPIDLTGIPDGTYVLHAIVDPQHALTESNPDNDVVDTELQIAGNQVTVLSQASPTTVPPTITMTSPTAGAQLQGTVALEASASATAPATVASVQYLLDGEPLGSPVTTAPFTYNWSAGNTPPGPYTLSAQVTDSNGNVGTAPSESVSVVPNTSGGVWIDAATTKNAHGNAVTNPISTTVAGDTLVAFASLDGPSTGGQSVTTVIGGGLTWHLVTRANAQLGDAEIWAASSPGVLSGVRIESKPHVGGYAQQLSVVAFAGAAGVGASANASGPSGAPSVGLTTDAAGSVSFAVGEDWDHAVSRTIGAGQSMLYQWIDSTDGDTFWVQNAADPSASAGQDVTLTDTAPTSDQWNMSAVEVEPAQSAAPALAVVVPPLGDTVSAVSHLAAVAADPMPIRSVQFYVDGRPVGGPVTRAPYALARWNTTRVANGTHTITAVARDSQGRVVTARDRVMVNNPAPAMTCFVLQADVSAQGTGQVTAPAFHTASADEQLLAFTQSAPGNHRTASVSGGGVSWHRIRSVQGAQGDVAVWSATAPHVLDRATVSAHVASGHVALTVVAMEGTDGLGASTGSAGSGRTAELSLTTSRPTSLVFSAGVQDGSRVSVPPGWAPISSQADGLNTAWVQYSNQPALSPRTRVAIPQPAETNHGWSAVALELPGDGA